MVQELLDRREESENLDYKEKYDLSVSSGKKELGKDLAAFANTRGGHILVGVDDTTIQPVGINKSEVNTTMIHQIAASIKPPVPLHSDLVSCQGIDFLLLTIEPDGRVHEIGPGKVPYRNGDTTGWADAERITMMKQKEHRLMIELQKMARRRIAGGTPTKLLHEPYNEEVFDVVTAEEKPGLFLVYGKPSSFRLFIPHTLKSYFLQEVRVDRSVRLQVGADCEFSYCLKREAILDYAGIKLWFVLFDSDGNLVAFHEFLSSHLSGILGPLEDSREDRMNISSHYNLRALGNLDYCTQPDHPYLGGICVEVGLLNNARLRDASGVGPFWIKIDGFEWAEY